MISIQRLYKPVLILSAILIGYGYACRLFQLNLFWESRYIGWMILFVGAILWLLRRIPQQKTIGKKTILEKIGVGLLCFIIIIQICLLFVFPNSAAFAAAKNHLRNEKRLVDEIGQVESFSIVPKGSLSSYSSGEGEAGTAELNVIVKGSKAYRDVMIQVVKELDTEWTVVDEEW